MCRKGKPSEADPAVQSVQVHCLPGVVAATVQEGGGLQQHDASPQHVALTNTLPNQGGIPQIDHPAQAATNIEKLLSCEANRR
jgi:hypothetical protein